MFMIFFFFKQKTAYEMRISDWSSDVCSSDLAAVGAHLGATALPVKPGRAQVRSYGLLRLLLRPLPALHRDLARTGNGEFARRRVVADHRAGADGRALADRHRRHQRDRKHVVSGKSVTVRVDLGGRREI